MTIVPLKLYFNEQGRAKVEIALGARQEAARQARNREEARPGSASAAGCCAPRAKHGHRSAADPQLQTFRIRSCIKKEALEDDCMALPITLDHCVIHVSDWERSNAFYRDVLGAELVRRAAGMGLPVRRRAAQSARSGRHSRPKWRGLPVQPGNSDLCFEWNGPDRRRGRASRALRGPDRRRPDASASAPRGAGTSVYFRDPDGSLLEFISYSTAEDSAHERAQSRSRQSCLPSFRCRRTTARRAISPASKLPSVPLPATDGSHGRSVASLPAARWSTSIRAPACPGSRCPTAGMPFPARAAARRNPARFRDHFAELKRLGVAHCIGLSTQDTDYQREAVRAAAICRFRSCPIANLALTRALKLPTFTVAGMTLLKRMALGDRRRRDHQGVLSGVPAGQERRGGGRLAVRTVEVGAHLREDRAEHLRRQHAGVRVVARAVIAREQRASSPISSDAPWPNGAAAPAVAERGDGALVRDAAERHDGAQIRHLGDGRPQKARGRC